MISPKNELELEIRALLTEGVNYLHANEIRGDYNWTLKFKELLAILGERKGFKVCTSGFQNQFNNEWLYDMVWYQEDEYQRLIDVPLVVESEWGSKLEQIKFDFEKLLLANSPNKLMICQSYSSKVETLLNYFEKAIQSYKLNKPGDKYMVAILDIKEEEFKFEVFIKN